MRVTVPVNPGRVCAKHGCDTILSIWNPFDRCNPHTERHIMPSPGVYINMKDGVPPLPVNAPAKPQPLKYGQCPECKRIVGKDGCSSCTDSQVLAGVATRKMGIAS